jgi:hypothetical protein
MSRAVACTIDSERDDRHNGASGQFVKPLGDEMGIVPLDYGDRSVVQGRDQSDRQPCPKAPDNRAVAQTIGNGRHRQSGTFHRPRPHFPSDEAATKLLYLVLKRSEKEWKMSPREWSMAKAQFAVIFGERFIRAMAA